MNEPVRKIGIIKTLRAKLILSANNGCVSDIIKEALSENGYDLTINPTFDERHYCVGEEITVYKIDNRNY